ncbi:hypothetical protein BXO88_01770 [Oribacterium sp. C9]|uniref:hypothetical protein n=1 Tax=Oribacterium sp. C9 TaxID=1943579 RepID=UPI00098EB47D|nr:hypothetical protein [Oribacterium sp. C9]OON87931.1 hypothetical protein BXO88_01770 [Oribacterium sp. C9]
MSGKMVKVLLAAVVISTVCTVASLADQWEKDGDKWRYRDYNGDFVRNRWVGPYFLGSDGIMLTDAYTPDGYYVGPDGRWDGRDANMSKVENPVSSIGLTIFNSPVVDDEINWGEKTLSYNGRAVQIIESKDGIIHDCSTYYEIPNAVVKGAIFDEYDEHGYETIASGPVFVRKSATVDFYDYNTGVSSVKTAEQIYHMYGSLFEYKTPSLCTIGCATEFDANGYIIKLSVHGFE